MIVIVVNTVIYIISSPSKSFLPGHPPELSDSVKLLLTDVKRHGFGIDQVLKSID